jgi:hypothetical protein
VAHPIIEPIERRQIERFSRESRQAIISKAECNRAILTVDDPGVALEARVEQGRPNAPKPNVDARAHTLADG